MTVRAQLGVIDTLHRRPQIEITGPHQLSPDGIGNGGSGAIFRVRRLPRAGQRQKQSSSAMQANCRVRPEGVARKTLASRCLGRRKAAIHSGSHQLTAACRAMRLRREIRGIEPLGEASQGDWRGAS